MKHGHFGYLTTLIIEAQWFSVPDNALTLGLGLRGGLTQTAHIPLLLPSNVWKCLCWQHVDLSSSFPSSHTLSNLPLNTIPVSGRADKTGLPCPVSHNKRCLMRRKPSDIWRTV